MGFESLLGNDRLKQNLISSLRKGRTSHFYLISGPEGSGKHTLARLLAAAILCGQSDPPCLHCHSCKKVMENLHPDFITIDDPEKKTVPVDLIRDARADMYVQPNESDHKIYLFPRAQDMGLPGQNALLKVLEEPPSYGVFILLTDNPEKLLPTVRSRCVELDLTALPEPVLIGALRKEFPDADRETLQAVIVRSGGFLGQARHLMEAGNQISPQLESFAQSFAKKDAYGLMQVFIPMEKWKRDALIDQLRQFAELLEHAMAASAGMSAFSPLARNLGNARSSSDLLKAIGHLEKAITYAQSNVSPAAICGYLSWALR